MKAMEITMMLRLQLEEGQYNLHKYKDVNIVQNLELTIHLSGMKIAVPAEENEIKK